MKDFLIRKIASSSSFVAAHSHSNFIEINGQSRLEDSRWTNSLEKCTEFILQSHSVLRPWGPYLVREFPRYSDYFYLDTLSNNEESVTGGFFICKIKLSETDWGYREWIVYITDYVIPVELIQKNKAKMYCSCERVFQGYFDVMMTSRLTDSLIHSLTQSFSDMACYF